MTHNCGYAGASCGHYNIKYCPHCGKVYCENCNQTWTKDWTVVVTPLTTGGVTWNPTWGVQIYCEHKGGEKIG